MTKIEKMDLPLLSVVVPVYGVEEYLRECIDSIINQVYKNLEIILVDDGSKGQEGIICDEYAAIDSRVKVIHKQNAGLIAARKTGIKEATAEYIAFVDGDDFISADYYSKMMEIVVAEKPDLVAVSFTQYYSKDKCEIIQQHMESGIYSGENLCGLFENVNCKNERWYDFSVFPSTCMKIYKTSKLKEHALSIPENIRIGEDSAFSYPYILSCQKVVVDNSITGYYYRVVETSMVRNRDKKQALEIDELYNFLKPFYEKTNNEKICRQLDIYRIYLLNVILEWMMRDVKFGEVHSRSKDIKDMALATGVFEDVNLDGFLLPQPLGKSLLFISGHNWSMLEAEWINTLVKTKINVLLRKVLRH
ncbi:glycosyltransferase family 2 protein [Butyrivibrio sp. NC3005]|uniref:glycosyltransferase family 2 protein n=1 Tax=Butyrivibrio sp. NC3005 TaxID=1280685 RepID=UPI0004170355|nr:glycosyltransferase family 2 protein [Butyrivibrio sp. NC3005]